MAICNMYRKFHEVGHLVLRYRQTYRHADRNTLNPSWWGNDVKRNFNVEDLSLFDGIVDPI